MTWSRQRGLGGVAAAIALLAAGAACGKGDAPPGGARAGGGPVPVVLGTAETRDVPVALDSVGTVEPMATVDVRPQIGGMLIEAAFQEGDEVRAGDVLFRIDDRPYAAALAQARANLARDKAQLAAAEREAVRARELEDQKYVSASERDRAVATAESLRAAVQADEAAIRNAQLSVSWCTLRSPIDGRTGALRVKPGNIVQANVTPLVTIHQLRPIQVAFSVPEARLPAVQARIAAGGVQVEATPQGDRGAPLSGPVTFVGNEVDRTTGTVTLKARFPNDDGRLWPGQFVRVRAIVGQVDGAVVVPSAAIEMGQQGSFLFAVKADGTADLRRVRTGPSVDGWTVVEGPVAAGDRVVVDGQSRLSPGAMVHEKPRDAGKPAEPAPAPAVPAPAPAKPAEATAK